MMRYLRTLLLWALGLGALAAIFIYGSGPADHYWLAAPGWSRAQRVTTGRINAAAPLAVGTDGTLYLFTVERDPDRSDVELLRPFVRAFDAESANIADGPVRWTYRMPVVLDAPEQPQLHLADGGLHLFWLDDGQVFTAAVGTDGTLVAAPTALSGATPDVGTVNHYSVASDGTGRMALWTGGSRGQPGVYAIALDEPNSPPRLIDGEGLYPKLRFDAQGTLHAVWYRFPLGGDLQFFHGRFPRARYDDGSTQPLLNWPVRPRSELQAYHIGLEIRPNTGLNSEPDAGTLYLSWTESVNTGGQVRGVETHFAHVPIRAGSVSPPASSPHPLHISLSEDETQEESLAAAPINLAPALNPAAELAVAFSAQLPGPQNRNAGQIGVLFLREGTPISHQLLSTSSATSFAPMLVRDDAGDQYITWLERATGGAGYHVYLAGTSEGLRAGLSRLTANDVARVITTVLFNMATGALLGPVLLLWVIAPLLLLVACRVGRGEWMPPMDREFVGRVGAAIILFWIVKVWTMPGMLGHVPLAGWVPVMPSPVGWLLRIGVPPAIGGLSVVWARAFLRRVDSPSPALFVIAYAAFDSVLTAAIYGSLLYERFFQSALAAS